MWLDAEASRFDLPKLIFGLLLDGRYSGVGEGSGPVSYTHLDVYKRQEYGRERDFKSAFLEHLLAVLVIYPEAHVAVSYTHLDVYKRQV